MTPKSVVSGILILALCVAFATPARADSLPSTGRNIVLAVIAVTAAVAIVGAIVIIHYSHKRPTITGCVMPGTNGMTLTDEIDRQTYALAGRTRNVKTGERMQLRGKTAKPAAAGQSLIWETSGVNRDFGVCQPSHT